MFEALLVCAVPVVYVFIRALDHDVPVTAFDHDTFCCKVLTLIQTIGCMQWRSMPRRAPPLWAGSTEIRVTLQLLCALLT